MYEIKKEFTFEAAHELPLHDGKCKRLHGHSWKGAVVLRRHRVTQSGPQTGMLQDFSEVKEIIRPILENFLDHHFLNQTTNLPNPTSEALAHWLYHQWKPCLPLLIAVEIQETCTSFARYDELPYGWAPGDH